MTFFGQWNLSITLVIQSEAWRAIVHWGLFSLAVLYLSNVWFQHQTRAWGHQDHLWLTHQLTAVTWVYMYERYNRTSQLNSAQTIGPQNPELISNWSFKLLTLRMVCYTAKISGQTGSQLPVIGSAQKEAFGSELSLHYLLPIHRFNHHLGRT